MYIDMVYRALTIDIKSTKVGNQLCGVSVLRMYNVRIVVCVCVYVCVQYSCMNRYTKEK